MELLAWTAAFAGIALGAIASFVPGFPGCSITLLGLLAFAGLTDFAVVGPWALATAALIAIVGASGQVLAPVATSRWAGGSAGAATGATLGAIAGALVPLPLASWALAVLGAAVLGVLGSRGARWAAARGVVGTAGGCLYGMVLDLVAVLGIAGVLGLADFLYSVW